MRTRLGPELQVAGCAAFWGSIGLVVREIDLSALTIVTYRVAIASITLGLWLLLRPDEVGRRFVVHRPGRTLLQGVTLAVHWVLFFAALQRAPVGLVTLIVFLAPVLMAAVAPFTLGEHLTRRTGAALGLALVGTILLVGLGAEGVEVAGLVYALLAAVLLAVLLVNAKVLSPLYGGRRLALAQVTIASVVLVPVAVAGDGAWPTRADVAGSWCSVWSTPAWPSPSSSGGWVASRRCTPGCWPIWSRRRPPSSAGWCSTRRWGSVPSSAASWSWPAASWSSASLASRRARSVPRRRAPGSSEKQVSDVPG